jgi:hypothetical protein
MFKDKQFGVDRAKTLYLILRVLHTQTRWRNEINLRALR